MLKHLHLKRVLSVLEELCDVELGREAAVLRVADFLAVHVEIHRGRNAAEVDDDAAVLPVRGNGERARVEPDGVAELVARVVLRRLNHRVALVPAVDRVGGICVERGIILALELPAPGNGDFGRLLPILGVDVVLPLEAPSAVEGLKPLRFRARPLALRNRKRHLGALARNHNRTGRKPVHLEPRRVLPYLLRARTGGRRKESHRNNGIPHLVCPFGFLCYFKRRSAARPISAARLLPPSRSIT